MGLNNSPPLLVVQPLGYFLTLWSLFLQAGMMIRPFRGGALKGLSEVFEKCPVKQKINRRQLFTDQNESNRMVSWENSLKIPNHRLVQLLKSESSRIPE